MSSIASADRNHRLVQCLTAAVVASLMSCQPPPPVRIVGPTDGTVVRPGDRVVFDIEVSDPTVTEVLLLSQLPHSDEAETVPLSRLELVVSPEAADGAYISSVLAIRPSGVARSTKIEIIVDSGRVPTELSVQDSSVFLRFVGQHHDPVVTASNGVEAWDVTPSGPTRVVFTSVDESVATVDSQGTITAVGTGMTWVTVSLDGISTGIAVQVAASPVGDLDADGDVDSQDLIVVRSYLNTNAAIPGDGRDLNSDGKVDALDTRELVLKCTRPRCEDG